LEAVLWIVLIQPHPLTSGILIKVVQYVQVKSSKEEVCISFDLSSSDASDIIVVVQVFLFGTNCTGEFFLWVVRWTSHSIAVSFNMVE